MEGNYPINYVDQMMDHQLNLSKVRDRANKKWVAMMFPEHLKVIREYIEEQKKIPKPLLNERDLDIIQDNVQIGSISWVEIKRRIVEIRRCF